MVSAYAAQQIAGFGVAAADFVPMHVRNVDGPDCLAEVAIDVRMGRVHNVVHNLVGEVGEARCSELRWLGQHVKQTSPPRQTRVLSKALALTGWGFPLVERSQVCLQHAKSLVYGCPRLPCSTW